MTDTLWEVYNVVSTCKGDVFVMSKKVRYDEEFKLRAARLVVEQDYSYRQTAERLGASSWSIRQLSEVLGVWAVTGGRRAL